MGKHNQAAAACAQRANRRRSGSGIVLAGWAAPIASADDGAAATKDKPSNPISKTADAVKSTVDGVRKAVTDVGSSLQRRSQGRIQTGAGGTGTRRR